jgi:hypothetical protein
LQQSSPLSFDDIAQQSPTLVHRTRASEAAYRYAVFNVRIEGEGEENFRSLENFGSLE